MKADSAFRALNNQAFACQERQKRAGSLSADLLLTRMDVAGKLNDADVTCMFMIQNKALLSQSPGSSSHYFCSCYFVIAVYMHMQILCMN